jgi:biofilm protein TabA
MIVDKIENAELYSNLSENIANALQVLRQLNPAELTDGRHDIDGDRLYLVSQHYETKPFRQGKLEAHRKYIDIQSVAAGRELLGYAPLGNLETAQPYDEAKDVIFYEVPDKISSIVLTPGLFCILFPEDTHMPGCGLNAPSGVHKVVVKVRIHA